MLHLSSVSRAARAQRKDQSDAAFPLNVPAIASLHSLTLSTVTFFVGENGSGKSTLMEAIAAAAGLPTVGGADIARDATLASQRAFAGSLKLVWKHRTRRGFFLRAEDFFGFTKRLAQERVDLQQRMRENAEEYEKLERSTYALGLAQGPLAASLADMEKRYGVDPDAQSHGESFLKLFRNRFVPGGLYLLDEPEAPLSPQSQLALIAMLMEMIEEEAQFIIATHSPILLAFPEATIYSFDELPIAEVAYDDLDHVNLTRDFLNHPGRYLQELKRQ